MPGYAAGKTRAHIFNLQDVDQKGAELMRSGGDRLSPATPRFVVGKKLVKMFHHGNAGSGWRDDEIGVGFLEDLDKSFGEFSGRLSIASVVRGLTATGLAIIEYDLAAGSS